MKKTQRLTLWLTLFVFLPSCLPSRTIVSLKSKHGVSLTKVVTSVSVVNNQVIITGNGFSDLTSLKIGSNTFTIESLSSTQIVANGTQAFSFGVGQILDLVLSNAEGAATFPVSFTLNNGSVTASMLSNMGATSGQVLKYNGTTWVPSSMGSGQLYVGTWNATTNTPDPNAAAPVAGDYYIVTTAGTQNLGTGAIAYAVGDWIIYNGTSWDKIQNSTNTVASFNGRTGIVVPATGDYTWAQITKTSSKLEDIADIDITGRADGKILQWSAGSSKWIMGNASTGTPSAGSVTDSSISAGASIAQSKISNLVSDLAGKEGTITAAATTKYFRGDKTFVTLDTSVVPENGSLYFTNARALGVALTGLDTTLSGTISATDTVLQAFGKTQKQITAKLDSGTFVDWSVAGVATLEPTRLNLTTANRAVVTNGSGVPAASSVTATELGYVSGVTSAIQTQLNSKQATIDKTIVQPVSTVRLFGANATNYVELSVPVLAGNTTYKFPSTDGVAGQVLSTDHAGNLSWITAEGTITAAATTKFFRGDKTFVTLDTSVVPENGSLYFTNARTLASVLTGVDTTLTGAITATDTVLQGFGKAQKQIGNKLDSATFVDWSVAGVATLEPTRLNLTTANRAVVTNGSGVPAASSVTATELGYVSGVTSAIQTQLNAKEPTITAGTTAQYLRGNKSLSTFTSDVLATALTGLSTATNLAITAADTVIVAMGKLQSQMTASVSAPVSSVTAFAGASAPSGWFICDGSPVSRTTYANLFAAIGTSYGPGDGSTTFNLPDLRGRAPIGAGPGAGLTSRTLASSGGTELVNGSVAVSIGMTTNTAGNAIVPAAGNNVIGGSITGPTSAGIFAATGSPLTVSLDGVTVTPTGFNGGNGTDANMQPFVALNYIIKY